MAELPRFRIVSWTDTTVVSVKIAELRKRGINSFKEWESRPNTVYIGRQNHYVGAKKSKWANPYAVKKYGLDQCLIMYEDYIRSTPELMNSLEELRGKELGCWCSPQPCHGNILVKLLNP